MPNTQFKEEILKLEGKFDALGNDYKSKHYIIRQLLESTEVFQILIEDKVCFSQEAVIKDRRRYTADLYTYIEKVRERCQEFINCLKTKWTTLPEPYRNEPEEIYPSNIEFLVILQDITLLPSPGDCGLIIKHQQSIENFGSYGECEKIMLSKIKGIHPEMNDRGTYDLHIIT